MAALILLNGPPAVGKSTIAERLVAQQPLSLNLDIDVVRGLLGAWIDQPTEAGLAARRLALAMIDAHLRAGHHVVVPQLLARPEFIDQLADAAKVAGVAGVEFVHISLDLDRADAAAVFEDRRASTNPTHREAAALVDASADADPLGEMYDHLQRLLADRPEVRHVPVVRGNIDATLRSVEREIVAAGINWHP